METRTITVYRFSELTPQAQARAIQDAEAHGWGREADYMASLKALAVHFGGELSDWDIDWSGAVCPSSARFTMPEDMHPAQILERLSALGGFDPKTYRGNGDCVLTGLAVDEDAIDGFRLGFMRDKSEDLNNLMQCAFKSWLKSAHENYAYDFGEGYAETADINDYLYTADGRKYYEGR